MRFFEWIQKSIDKVKVVEERLYNDKTQIVEIYQRNLALEKEIEQRTEELHKANQTLITLENVWDMMNSSRPLSNVLEAIVNSLHGEFGYLYSCILQKSIDKDGEFLAFKTFLQNSFSERLGKALQCNIYDTRVHYENNGTLDKTMKEGKITCLNDIAQALKELYPNLDSITVAEITRNALTQSVIILPLKKLDEFFGFLCVFSPRYEPKESELNFLNLFARQIELAITIASLFETVKKQAVTDGLTELFNRRFYEDALSREATRSLRLNQPFSLISLDLDDLKKINDAFGHTAGDNAIKSVASAILKNARSVDIASRIGGEEFSIILPGIDSRGAKIAAERLLSTIEKVEVEDVGRVTASIGVATFIEQTLDVDKLAEMADRAMYNAKKKGKDRVEMAANSDEISWQDTAIETFIEILDKHKIPFDTKTAKSLVEKLQNKNKTKQGKSTKDLLYSVVDTISKSYAPNTRENTTKDKVYLATLVAKRMELNSTDIDRLKLAILLYDIGNTMVPTEVLNKTSPLSEEDKEKINKHPIIAAQKILKPITKVADIIPIIEQHHENWDGSGYPLNKKGSEIPITSQIILIVDSFFAMTSDRPYRKAYTVEQAIEEIKKSAGKKYNEVLAKEFIEAIRESRIF